jgi:hypothetical protein
MGARQHLSQLTAQHDDIAATPGGAVHQMDAIPDSIDGPWTVTTMVDGESLGVPSGTPSRAVATNRGLWLHQGGMVDTPSGEWWSVIMSDHGSAGRMVSLLPITWDGGFPLIGLPGNLRKAPNTWVKPDTGVKQEPVPSFVRDENFNGTKFNPHWQWNHVPDDTKWSLTEKPGVLRLHSLPAANFYNARNSLSQRPPAPESRGGSHNGMTRVTACVPSATVNQMSRAEPARCATRLTWSPDFSGFTYSTTARCGPDFRSWWSASTSSTPLR